DFRCECVWLQVAWGFAQRFYWPGHVLPELALLLAQAALAPRARRQIGNLGRPAFHRSRAWRRRLRSRAGASLGRAAGSGTDACAEAGCVVDAAGAASFAVLGGVTCGNSFAIFADGRSSGPGSCRPRAAGSRPLWSSMANVAM